MKSIRVFLISILNWLPKRTKWRLFKNSFFNARLRISFEKTRSNSLFPNGTILVIGGNDGLSFDNLFQQIQPTQVRGLVLEPSQKYFKFLERNLKNFPNLILLPIALHKTGSILPLYQLNEQGLKKMPIWGQGLGSFSKDHLLKFDSLSESDLEVEWVQSKSFMQLVEENHLNSVDYLQIDTEGFDAEIIKMIDFNRFGVRLLKFEWANLTLNELKEVESILRKEGFFLIKQGGDCLGYSQDVNLWFY